MGLSNPKAIYSILGVTIIDPTTGKPAGKMIQVLENSNLSYSGENVELKGGALRTAWEIESGDITAEMSLAFSEYPEYLTKFLLGATTTSVTAQSVSAPVATVGSSLMDVVDGITGVIITAGSEDDLKTSPYYLVGKTATTASLYMATDVNSSRGATIDFIDDSMIVKDDIDLSATAIIADLGITIEVVGTPNFTVGDAIEFEVNAQASGYEFKVGAPTDVFPEFKAVILAEQSSTGALMQLTCFRCQATGMPIGFTRKAFSNSEVTVGLKYSSSEKAVFKGKFLKE